MSLFVDKQFVSLISNRLVMFKRKSEYLWNFRCPFCNDSKKNKIKCRGYLYRGKENISFMCHNCSVSMSLGNLIKSLDANLYSQYQMETYKNSHGGNVKKPKFDESLYAKPVFRTKQELTIPTINELEDSHTARQFIKKRKIPESKWNSIHYTDDFLKFCDETFPHHGKNLIKEDPRIVLPFYSESGMLLGVQGRSLDKKSSIRYITIKATEESTKAYGLNTIDFSKTINVVEGPFDSMFIDNCVALMDSALYRARQIIGKDYDYRLIFDNEKRNAQITKNMKKSIELGYKICIFPENISEKDINDMVLAGLDIPEIIDTNTHEGLKATISLNNWRKDE